MPKSAYKQPKSDKVIEKLCRDVDGKCITVKSPDTFDAELLSVIDIEALPLEQVFAEAVAEPESTGQSIVISAISVSHEPVNVVDDEVSYLIFIVSP